jgi:hypothetical protein
MGCKAQPSTGVSTFWCLSSHASEQAIDQLASGFTATKNTNSPYHDWHRVKNPELLQIAQQQVATIILRSAIVQQGH